jgi:ASC-1-like (ASCH) protein
MANITLRFRSVNKKIFDAIRAGKKKVETRAATVRYRKIKKGDTLIFSCGKLRFEKKVKNAKVYKNIPALLKKYSFKTINPFVKSASELEKMYYSFPGYREKIKKFGIIALEL